MVTIMTEKKQTDASSEAERLLTAHNARRKRASHGVAEGYRKLEIIDKKLAALERRKAKVQAEIEGRLHEKKLAQAELDHWRAEEHDMYGDQDDGW